MRQRVTRLIAPLTVVGAIMLGCGSHSGSHGSTSSAPAADPQPFTRITQASPTTQAELGVVQWWAVYDPSGLMSIGGLDTSNTVVVAFNSSPTQFNSSPTQSILQDLPSGQHSRSRGGSMREGPGSQRVL
jgi:hypothetical protein